MSLLLSTSIDSDSLRSWADEKSLNIFLQERKKNNKTSRYHNFFIFENYIKKLCKTMVLFMPDVIKYIKSRFWIVCAFIILSTCLNIVFIRHSWYMFQIYLLFRMKHFQWPIMYRILNRCCQYVFHKISSKYLVLHGWTIIYTDEK